MVWFEPLFLGWLKPERYTSNQLVSQKRVSFAWKHKQPIYFFRPHALFGYTHGNIEEYTIWLSFWLNNTSAMWGDCSSIWWLCANATRYKCDIWWMIKTWSTKMHVHWVCLILKSIQYYRVDFGWNDLQILLKYNVQSSFRLRKVPDSGNPY